MKKFTKIILTIILTIAAAFGSLLTAEAAETVSAPYNENPLTGIADLADEAVGKRPVAVMINNHPDNYPQWNIGKADVIFEIVVEHDLTRFMALFADYQNVPYLVSVRSYRYYFPALSNGFDAVYIHWGEDQTMMDYYEELDLDSYDGLSNDFLFGRDQERLDAGYALEHSSCFYGSKLPEQLAADGVDMNLDKEHVGPAFNFVPYGTVVQPDGNDCSFIDIQFGAQTAQFTYDEANGVYVKYANEEPQIDGISGEQLAFENVIVLYTEIYPRDDEPEADRRWLDVFGGLDEDYAIGYYASEGKVQNIRWAKEDESSRLKFYDMDGNELEINRGKSYIAFTYEDSATVSTEIPETYLP